MYTLQVIVENPWSQIALPLNTTPYRKAQLFNSVARKAFSQMMYLQQHVIIIDHGFQIPSPTHVQLLNLLVKCMCIINEYELSQWLVLKSIGNSSFLLVLDLNTTIAAVVSSVAAILISSIFFLCVGCICGRRHHQQKLVESGGYLIRKVLALKCNLFLYPCMKSYNQHQTR